MRHLARLVGEQRAQRRLHRGDPGPRARGRGGRRRPPAALPDGALPARARRALRLDRGVGGARGALGQLRAGAPVPGGPPLRRGDGRARRRARRHLARARQRARGGASRGASGAAAAPGRAPVRRAIRVPLGLQRRWELGAGRRLAAAPRAPPARRRAAGGALRRLDPADLHRHPRARASAHPRADRARARRRVVARRLGARPLRHRRPPATACSRRAARSGRATVACWPSRASWRWPSKASVRHRSEAVLGRCHLWPHDAVDLDSTGERHPRAAARGAHPSRRDPALVTGRVRRGRRWPAAACPPARPRA